VEPEYYVPIIPFALINGASGIGTGFSSSIPPYNPQDVVKYLKIKLTKTDEPAVDFVPYYEGFKGSVCKVADNKFVVRGVYEQVDADSIRITELPIGTWTMPYITFLEGLVDGGVDKAGKKIAPTLKDFKSVSTEINVDILVQFPKGVLSKMTPEAIDKTLKLSTTVSSTNMHMFNQDCKLHKYASVEEIIDEFSVVRLEFYQKRKTAMVDEMRQKLVKLSNRARYILATLDGEIDLRRMPNTAIVQMMESKEYDKIDGDYNYLVKMPMDSVSEENARLILEEKEKTAEDLATLMATTCEQMWMKELEQFETEYAKYKMGREMQQRANVSGAGGAKKKLVVIRKSK